MIKKYKRNWKNHQVVVFGDLHGEFEVLRNKINSGKFDNCIILIAGDCGFGFFLKQKLKGIMKHLERACKKHHVLLTFLRGNHDDNKYWKDDNFLKEMTGIDNFCSSHIQFVKDYTFIEVINKLHEKSVIFAVGGGTSIDRLFRKEGSSYWSGEEIDFNPFHFTKEELEPCEYIVSHVGETPPINGKNSLDYFLNYDDNLEKDLKKENEIIKLIGLTVKPKRWIYGHFHCCESFISEKMKCECVVLDCVNKENFFEII